ncbi:MAG: hypothetical protein LH702_19750 [Phormidesmis sp. CAN_BIN44]|nr:hypothetical protein [Phormidesmis sp. CAN_BIN44]
MLIPEEYKQEIEEYLSLDENLLYSLIPPYLEEGRLYSPEGQIEEGKRKFDELKPSLYENICINWDCCSKIDAPALQDNINLIATLADIVAVASSSIGIPPFIIATILVKIGLRRFCKCRERNAEKAD